MTNIDDIKLAGEDIAFVRNNCEVVFPEYAARDNLKLWYDFSGRTNTDAQKGVAEDLSGNGNNGTLNGFAYASGSGYEDGGLKGDGIDDNISGDFTYDESDFTLEFTFKLAGGVVALGTFGFFNSVVLASNSAITARTNNGITTFTKSTANGTHNISIVYTSATKTLSAYRDGVIINNVVLSANIIKYDYYKALMAWQQGGNTFTNYMNDKLFSFRKYTKALTASEISHNYAIDKKRFNITD
jgi:hypothetical protein